MSGFFDSNLGEVEYDALDPLVPRYVERNDPERANFEAMLRQRFSGSAGDDIALSGSPGELRDRVIAAVVEAWSDPEVPELGPAVGNWDSEEFGDRPGLHAGVLDRVRLVDANETDDKGGPRSINLGDLLRGVSRRLAERGLWTQSSIDEDKPTVIAGVRAALRACDVPRCDASGLSLPASITTYALRIGGAAVFHESRIGGDAVFHESRIGGAAWFHDSRIGGAAGFHDSRIGGAAVFHESRIGGDAGFVRARIGGAAGFHESRIGGAAGFGGARIGGDAMFHESRIGGAAGFGGARIGGDAGFGGARIGGYTDFADCTFARQPRWWSARFWDGRFQGTGSMRSASFAQTRKDRAAFGGARAESAIRMLPPHRRRRPWWWWRLLGPTGWMMMVRRFASRVRLTDRPIADWGNARVLGEMDILARASLAALGVVPVIAAVWPTITSYIEQRLRVDPPSVLPWAWVTVFFAALLVVVGRMCYRGRCPDLIRGRSRFEFREQEMEEFRRTRDREGESRLLEARDDIRAAGENEHLRRAWHPDLIEVNARTMWLPQEISDIRWKQRRLPRSFFYDGPDEIDEARRTEAEAAIAEGREANEIDVVATPQPEISRTTLEDGIIKAGAEARYDLAALERPVSARTALWCYGLAFALLLTVIMYQCLVLMAETDIGVLIWFAERAVVVARYWRPFVIILPSLVFVLWLLDAFFGPNDAMDKKALEDPFDGEGVFGKRRADRS